MKQFNGTSQRNVCHKYNCNPEIYNTPLTKVKTSNSVAYDEVLGTSHLVKAS